MTDQSAHKCIIGEVASLSTLGQPYDIRQEIELSKERYISNFIKIEMFLDCIPRISSIITSKNLPKGTENLSNFTFAKIMA